jgi:hypothetical protein
MGRDAFGRASSRPHPQEAGRLLGPPAPFGSFGEQKKGGARS